MPFRIGFGFDVHPLIEGRPFILGGVTIPHFKGPSGHSDADVLTHAICDALLGAMALRDIGFHFPDTDPQYKDADSRILLQEVCRLLSQNGYRIGNIDVTICLEQPKLSKFIPSMIETLSNTMDTEEDRISIKATTNEAMGFVGREEGITAYAVVLIEK